MDDKKHKFKIDKLIRDKLPRILEDRGIFVAKKVMTDDEYIKSLGKKLLEESNEVILSFSQNKEEILEELADVLEVIYSIGKFYEFSPSEIEQKRLSKRSEKGGFDDKIYSEYDELDSQNKFLKYYLERSDKYPKLN